MSADIDWELEDRLLRKESMKLTKPKLIRLCKSRKVIYSIKGSKQEMVSDLINNNKSKLKRRKQTTDETDKDESQKGDCWRCRACCIGLLCCGGCCAICLGGNSGDPGAENPCEGWGEGCKELCSCCGDQAKPCINMQLFGGCDRCGDCGCDGGCDCGGCVIM